MPAIVTHYCFAEDAMEAHPDVCGNTRDECDAFLLGSQGPDPLFFVPGPEPFGTASLARQIHREQPSELLAALKQALSALNADEFPIGQAYAHGFLCHYLLDSHVHPLVYQLTYDVCDAGIDGLSREDTSTVHNYIEREWDEMALTVKLNTTVARYKPATILRASERVLSTVQKLYSFIALGVYGRIIDTNAFPRAVAAYRLEQMVIHSRSGIKRAALSKFEELLRPHSHVRAITPRPVEVETTWLANPDNEPWENPFTGEVSTDSFWDLYEAALGQVAATTRVFDADTFDIEAARLLTAEKNFRGQPVVATLTVHEE